MTSSPPGTAPKARPLPPRGGAGEGIPRRGVPSGAQPSGDAAHGFTPRHDTEPDTEADRATPEAGHSTGGTTATHVDGPVAQHGSRVTTGVDVSGSGNTITTVHGDQHRGPRYEGDGQIHVGGNNAGVIKQTMKGRRAR